MPGFRSHGGLYERFALGLLEHDLATHAIDLRGRGRSPGNHHETGLLAGFGRDVAALARTVRDREGPVPVFLLGHGVGAVVAGLWTAAHSAAVSGLICSSAAFQVPRGWLHGMTRVVPFAFCRTFADLRDASRQLRNCAADLSLPLLVMHGSADAVTSPAGSERLHGLAGTRDKTLQIFEGYDHDLMTGAGHDRVRDRMLRWLSARLDAATRIEQTRIEYINPE